MSNTDTCGPAFPQLMLSNGGIYVDGGMTLRDYFAAKAMQGWLATFPTDCAVQDVRPSPIALFAYEMADEMLKARQQ